MPEPPASTFAPIPQTCRCWTTEAKRSGPSSSRSASGSGSRPRTLSEPKASLRDEAARSAGCEPADEFLLPGRLDRAWTSRRPHGPDRGRWRGAGVYQRAGGDHPAPAEPTHACHDDRLASLDPVATPPDKVGGLAQRARSLIGYGKPAVVEPERLCSAAELGNSGPVELRFGGQAKQTIHALGLQLGKVRFEVAIAVASPGTDRHPEPAGPDVRGFDPVDAQHQVPLHRGSDLVGERARGDER